MANSPAGFPIATPGDDNAMVIHSSSFPKKTIFLVSHWRSFVTLLFVVFGACGNLPTQRQGTYVRIVHTIRMVRVHTYDTYVCILAGTSIDRVGGGWDGMGDDGDENTRQHRRPAMHDHFLPRCVQNYRQKPKTSWFSKFCLEHWTQPRGVRWQRKRYLTMTWYPSDPSGACMKENNAGFPFENLSCLYPSTLGPTYFEWVNWMEINNLFCLAERNSGSSALLDELSELTNSKLLLVIVLRKIMILLLFETRWSRIHGCRLPLFFCMGFSFYMADTTSRAALLGTGAIRCLCGTWVCLSFQQSALCEVFPS